MTLSVHPLEEPLEEKESTKSDFMNTTSTETPSPPTARHQQRAYSVTGMPNELQQKQRDDRPPVRSNQPWWQYYYQLYHYHLPPGRKPTVFGPYLLLQTLGEGEFGKVKFGIEIKTGQEVAIKLMRKDSIDSTSRMTKVEREISVLRLLHHPNIVELFDVIETEKYIGIILQCATGGELFDYILAHRYLKEKDASRLFAQLISGVHYMHQKHIVHRDLKLENLLLDRHRNVLITDFGFANQFASPNDDLMSTSCGSPCYAAPELVMNQGCYVGPAVDIWSCGVILFAMLCGYLPYDDDPANPDSYNINLLYKYILNTPLVFPDYISHEACDLMSLMLVPDPEKRCTMETIMAHPWLSTHTHLFDHVEQQLALDRVHEEEEEEQDQEIPIPRRNTVGPVQSTEDAVVPEKQDIPIQPVTPPLSPPTPEPEQEIEPKLEKQEEEEEEEGPISPLPTISKSTSTARPQKILSFLSGQSSTPKPGDTRQPTVSASTPLKKNSNKRQSSITPPAQETRRKTLSLLVDPFARRQSNAMVPSVSETTTGKKSAGKKLMDWFKKKPTGTHIPSNMSTDIKLRTHHGAVDQGALTSRAPHQVVNEVKMALKSLGLEYKRDGSEYKLRCERPKKIILPPVQQPGIRNLLRRPSAQQQDTMTIYGDPSTDPGDQVRFSVEVCKIKNLPGLYIVDMRRLRGNVWAYKFIYRTLMETLKLGEKHGYTTNVPESQRTSMASVISVDTPPIKEIAV